MPMTIISSTTPSSTPTYTVDDTYNILNSCEFTSLSAGDNIVITINGNFVNARSSDFKVLVFDTLYTGTTAVPVATYIFDSTSESAVVELKSSNSINIFTVGKTYYLYSVFTSGSTYVSSKYVEFKISASSKQNSSSLPNNETGAKTATSVDISRYLANLNTEPKYSTTGVNTTKEFIQLAIDAGVTFTQAQKDIMTKYYEHLDNADKAREIVNQVYNLIRLTNLAKYAAAADVDNALKEARNAAFNFYSIAYKTTLNSAAFMILSKIEDSSSFSINNLTLVLKNLDEILVYAINYAESKGLNKFDSTAIANSGAITNLKKVISLAINLPTRVN